MLQQLRGDQLQGSGVAQSGKIADDVYNDPLWKVK
jgi:hypothetical protein